MKKPALVIGDIDFTLVNSYKKMMPLTKEMLERLHDEEIPLGIASGRPIFSQLDQKYKEWGLSFQFNVIIGMNGGQLWDVDKNEYHEFYKLKKEYVKEIIDMMAPLHENFFVYEQASTLVRKMDAQTIESISRNNEPAIEAKSIEEFYSQERAKILFRMPDVKRVPIVKKYAEDHPSKHYICFQTGPHMIEFQDPRVTKGNALIEYCRMSNINIKDVIAFGDTTNDNMMLKEAGWGVCMKNGSDDTKKLADEITARSCEEDGIGHYIQNRMLSNNFR